MKTRTLIAATAALLLAGAVTASAEEDCDVRIGDWQPRSAVVKMAESKGWTVQRIKTDDGCYEIRCTDRDGRSFEATVDPATLEVLATEYEDGDDAEGRDGHRGDDGGDRAGEHRTHGDDHDDGHGDDDDDDGDDHGAAAPAGAPDPNAPVPDNGLFKGKVRPKVQVQ
jgi:hypothetical protein